MADRSKIEWTDATWNPIRARRLDTGKIGWHCTHVSEGCRFCYAESINRRLGTGLDYIPGNEKRIEIFLDEKMLLAPLRWRRPRKIFVGSMTDLFADFVTDEMLDRVFAVMALSPQHTFQLLTKRPARARAYFTKELPLQLRWWRAEIGDHPSGFIGALCDFIDVPPLVPLPNVWLGTSVEDQTTADARIPDLLATPAAIRFLSCEPILGPIDLNISSPARRGEAARSAEGGESNPGLHWLIAGGESGPHARPMHPDWPRALRDQCTSAGVPFFFKQWGEWGANDHDITGARARLADGTPMRRVGKKAAGRLLDRIEHNAFPAPATPPICHGPASESS